MTTAHDLDWELGEAPDTSEAFRDSVSFVRLGYQINWEIKSTEFALDSALQPGAGGQLDASTLIQWRGFLQTWNGYFRTEIEDAPILPIKNDEELMKFRRKNIEWRELFKSKVRGFEVAGPELKDEESLVEKGWFEKLQDGAIFLGIVVGTVAVASAVKSVATAVKE